MAFAINGDRRTGAVMDKKNFGTPIRICLQPDSKTVVRANYGIFYVRQVAYIRA